MPRVIALSQPDSKLADQLKERGYQVVGLNETHKHRTRVDAILYNSRHPHGFSSQARSEADLTVGHSCLNPGEPFEIPTLNITGMAPAQALALLESQLSWRGWHS